MYADITDQADAEIELRLTAALANRPRPVPLSTVCQNGDCGEPSAPGTNYCCSECREDAEKHERAARFNRH